MSGPLDGVRILELAGIGPAPFCAMALSDLGAEVVRVDRVGGSAGEVDPRFDVMSRNRRSITVNLKDPEGVALLLQMVPDFDVLIEGFRPGVAERLGLGPTACSEVNPRLVYGRMTGWGQHGTIAHAAGHDINFIALSGALHPIGRAGEAPVPPLNLVGDFGGGGMLLAMGICAALFEVQRSGKGQVIDAAVTDGSALLTAPFHGLVANGEWSTTRGTNLLDSGAHMYDVYACADGTYISIGSLEPQFYALLCRHLQLPAEEMPEHDQQRWPEYKQRIAAVVAQRTRDEWCAILEGTDVCFAPVLSLTEAPSHPHNVARATFVEIDGVTQPAPAPRFSRTPGSIRRPPCTPGQHTDEVLGSFLSPARIAELRAAGTIG